MTLASTLRASILGIAIAGAGLSLIACDGGSVPTPPVFSSTTYADAVKQNASDGKILVVKATAEWCPPCKQMNRETFVDAKVVEWINSHGTAIQLDTDANVPIARELNVDAIPTIIVYKGGKEIARASGYQGAGAFVSWLDASIAKK